jgi:quinol monooxygenase YgiN
MATTVVQHDVSEYGTWKAVYDSVDSLRAQYGCTAQRVLRSPENANSLLVLHEFPSLEKAQGFVNDPDLKEAMQQGGVAGPPRIELWEDANV